MSDQWDYSYQEIGESTSATLLVQFASGHVVQYQFPSLHMAQETWHELPDGSKILAAPGKLIGQRLTFSGMIRENSASVWKSAY